MPNEQVYYIGPAADVRYILITSVFGGVVLDEEQRSIISSLVAAEAAHLTSSARLTISRTSVRLTTGQRTVSWHMTRGSSLTVTRSSTHSWDDLSTSVLTSI